MNSTELKKHKQDVLIGSSRLAGSSSLFFDRTVFMVENMAHNKAYLSVLGRTKVNPAELLSQFQESYTEYRNSWHNQPKECINNSSNSKPLKNNYIPLCIDIETASVCDLACPFCYRESLATPDKIMNLKLFKNIIDQAVDMGVPSIKLNYRGEPLMHPKLYRMVEYAKQKGIFA